MAPSFADDAIDRTLHDGARGLEPSVLRGWQSVGESERPETLTDVLVDDGPRLVELVPEGTEVDTQKGTQHDGARETHHLFGDIDGLAA